MKFLSLLVLLTLFVPHLWSQQTRIKPTIFNKSDGFELSQVHAIEADNNGFLWLVGEDLLVRDILGTSKKLALQRFNGSSFDNVIIPENFGKVNSAKSIFKRSDGKFYINIYANKRTHIVLFDPITTKFTFFKNPHTELSTNSISAVYKHAGKNYLTARIGEEITCFELKDDLTFKSIFTFKYSETIVSVEDARMIMTDKICIISDNNMPTHVFNWKGKQLRKYNSSDFGLKNVTSKSQNSIDECFIQNNSCFFLLFSNPQLYELNLTSLDVNPVSDASIRSDNLYILQRGNKTTAVNRHKKHLSIFQISSDFESAFQVDTLFQNPAFGDDGVQRAFSRDLSKEMWIVTNQKQLLHYSIEKKPIHHVLEKKSIRSLYPYQKDEILVATDSQGWYILNYKTNESRPYSLRYKNKDFVPQTSRAFIKNGSNIWSTNYTHIVHVNLETKKIFQSKNYPITCIAKKSKSQFIYGTNSFELVLYDIPSDEHRTLLKTDSLDIIDVKVHHDWIIAGTDKGLLLYQFSNKKHQFIRKSKTLSDEYILSITKIAKNEFVLGTKFGKLFSFNVRTKKIELIYEDELKAGIANVLIGENKKWWLSTFNGLVCFNPETKAHQRYSTSNGLSNNEANRYSSLRIGKLIFFGSYKGLNYFSTDILKTKEDKAQLTLMMSEIFDSEKNDFQSNRNLNSLKSQTHFYLPAEQRSFKMRFAIQEGKIGGKYTIEYRLNNDRWTKMEGKNELYFSNLASGRYPLEVKLKDFSGKPIGKTLKYTLVVKRFFYQTAWFYVLIGVLGILIFTWYYIQLRKQAKMREQFSEDLIHLQENERGRISKELHDSVGQQLTLLKKTAQNRDQHEISEIANNTLEEVRSISQNLHPPLLSALGLTESIKALAHSFDEETDVFFTVDLAQIDHYFDQTESLHIYRFIQEGLSNLMKHAKAKTAYVEISLKGDKLVKVVIEDNGVGMKNSNKRFSLGLTTMQERIRILNGNFNIENPPKGTRLVAKIPIE